jgi:hypothetical protein
LSPVGSDDNDDGSAGEAGNDGGDRYEEAVTNHYSPELRARLKGSKTTGNLPSSAIGGPTRCKVSVTGNGIKVSESSLTAFRTEPYFDLHVFVRL